MQADHNSLNLARCSAGTHRYEPLVYSPPANSQQTASKPSFQRYRPIGDTPTGQRFRLQSVNTGATRACTTMENRWRLGQNARRLAQLGGKVASVEWSRGALIKTPNATTALSPKRISGWHAHAPLMAGLGRCPSGLSGLSAQFTYSEIFRRNN